MTTIGFRLARVFGGKRACTARLSWLAVLVVLVGSAFRCAPRIAASSDQKLSQIRVPTPPPQSADLPDALTQLAYELKVPMVGNLAGGRGGPREKSPGMILVPARCRPQTSHSPTCLTIWFDGIRVTSGRKTMA